MVDAAEAEEVEVNPALRFGEQRRDELRVVGDLKKCCANSATSVRAPGLVSHCGATCLIVRVAAQSDNKPQRPPFAKRAHWPWKDRASAEQDSGWPLM